MAKCKQQAFILAVKFTWILYSAGATTIDIPCAVTVTQPQSLEVDTASSNITIPCAFSTKGCHDSSPTVLWFRYLAHVHEDLCMPKCTQNEKFQAISTVPEKQASLQINNANVEDNAIYFCGVAFANSADPLSKQTGEGTALTIKAMNKESKKYSTGVYVMVVILLLLFIYIAAIIVSFKVFSKPKAKETKRGGHNTNVQIKGSGQSISQAIAQELRKKKNKLNRRPQQRLEKETIYQNK